MTAKPVLVFGDPAPPIAEELNTAPLIDGAVIGPVNDDGSIFLLHAVSVAERRTIRIARSDLVRLKLAIEQTLRETEPQAAH